MTFNLPFQENVDNNYDFRTQIQNRCYLGGLTSSDIYSHSLFSQQSLHNIFQRNFLFEVNSNHLKYLKYKNLR